MASRLKSIILHLQAVTAVFLLPAGLCLLMSACSGKDDVTAIGNIIRKGAVLAEEKHISDLMDLTAPGFLALPGHHDARTVKAIVFGALRQYGRFKILYPQPSISLTADESGASARVYFMIVRQNQKIPGLKELYHDPRRWLEAVGEKADLYQLKLQLRKEGGDWLVQQAQLEGFRGTGF